MARRMGLGRGLDAFFNTESEMETPAVKKQENSNSRKKEPAQSGSRTGKAEKKTPAKTSGKSAGTKKEAKEKEPMMVSIALIDTDELIPMKISRERPLMRKSWLLLRKLSGITAFFSLCWWKRRQRDM